MAIAQSSVDDGAIDIIVRGKIIQGGLDSR